MVLVGLASTQSFKLLALVGLPSTQVILAFRTLDTSTQPFQLRVFVRLASTRGTREYFVIQDSRDSGVLKSFQFLST